MEILYRSSRADSIGQRPIGDDATLRIDEIERRPVLVAECAPVCVAVVDHHRITDAEPRDRLGDRVPVPLAVKLRRVYRDNGETVRRVLRVDVLHGSVLRQFEQPKVQNSISTGRPRSAASERGGELSQCLASRRGSSGASGAGAAAATIDEVAASIGSRNKAESRRRM